MPSLPALGRALVLVGRGKGGGGAEGGAEGGVEGGVEGVRGEDTVGE